MHIICSFTNGKAFPLSHPKIVYLILYVNEIVVSFTQVSHFCCRPLKSGINNSEVLAKSRSKDASRLIYNYQRSLATSFCVPTPGLKHILVEIKRRLLYIVNEMTNIFKFILLKCFLQIQWQFVPKDAIQISQDKGFTPLSYSTKMYLNLFTVVIVVSFT